MASGIEPVPRGCDPTVSSGPMSDRQQRRFGRTSQADVDLLTYAGYLKLPELLSLQQLSSDPPVHDELLFIVVHQAYELWFKQMLFELESVRDRFFARDTERARHFLTRVHAIERVLIEHIEVLETMSPQDFLAFRDHLAPASGFQSAQFRELEFISGLKDPGFLQDLATSPEELEPARASPRRADPLGRILLAPRGARTSHAGRR